MSAMQRLGRAGSRLDEWIHPSIQRAVVTAIMLGVLAKMGLSLSAVNTLIGQATGVVEAQGGSISNLELAVSAALERSWQDRRKTSTLSNDLARIERKLDVLLEKPPCASQP